ncbi:insulin-like [Cololabis saira]|uniref:insulin-like n=1 Tax=Cololabis saira TaxID=129043 RepID=UPI002AD3D21E|nr:insulin-like [Cololabis saira]
MATLWIHTISVLLLLAVTRPSTEATSLLQLCGQPLVDALYEVCGDKGFYYESRTPNRGIVETCCHQPCRHSELANYCAD